MLVNIFNPVRLLLLAALMLPGLGLPCLAHATGAARVEYLRNGYVYSGETLTSTGTSVQGSAAPDLGGSAPGQVRITAVQGAVVVTPPGTSPTATQTNGVYLSAGAQPWTQPISTGQKIAIIEAAAPAANTVANKPAALVPLGSQLGLTVSSATALTVPTGATIAYIIVESQAVRWRDDGTNPTASVGNPVGVGAQLVYSGNLAAIKFIQQAASATLDVAYYQ